MSTPHSQQKIQKCNTEYNIGCNLKNDNIISVQFQGKPFNITLIQVYAWATIAKEVNVEQICEDLMGLTSKKKKKTSFSSLGIGMKK